MSPVTARYDPTENRFVREDSLVSGERVLRLRVTLAQLNAGLALLPAVPGFIYSLIDATVTAIGGAVTTATAVVITGTRAAGSVTLLSVAVAALTQSAVVRAGAANASVLADGASFTPLDVNTGITIGVTGSPATVASNVDVVLEYTLVPA